MCVCVCVPMFRNGIRFKPGREPDEIGQDKLIHFNAFELKYKKNVEKKEKESQNMVWKSNWEILQFTTQSHNNK